MPPRAVRRPSTVTPLKKRQVPRAVVETKDEAKEPELDTAKEEHIETLLPNKEEKPEKDLAPGGYNEVERSERLELEDNDPHSEAEDYAGASIGMEEHGEEMVYEDERHEEERIYGDSVMENVTEGEEEEGEEDGGDEHREEMDGYEEEHHDVVKERRKRKEFEVFVGGLDRDASEEDLREVFSQVGEVTEVRLMKNPLTQKNKGFAFLRFATVEQARRAVNELKHPSVNGKQCGVAPSQDSDTLFVGNICKTWTKEALKEKLAQYGVEKFEDLTLVEDTKNEGMNRGFAFLDFSSRADALDACKCLQRRDVIFGTDRTAKVAFADTFIEPDDEIMSQVKTIFLDGLPATWDEDRVKEHLKKFGKIEKVELARNMPAAKRTDFGFITFETHDAAVACAESINNTELGDGDRKVKVRARLSRPRQRGKLVKHTRGGYLVGHGGKGGKVPWGASMSHVDSWRSSGRSDRGTQSRNTYSGGFKRSLGPRDKHLAMDVIPDRVGSRRQFPSLEKSFDRVSHVPSYGKNSSRRDYARHDESFSRSSEFARAPNERRSSYRDAFPSRGSGYAESPPRSSYGTARRPPPFYAEDNYGKHMERPSSYRDSHSREYSFISGSKRPHSAMEEYPRYTESTLKHTRARFDYEGSSHTLPYNDSVYESESTRLGRASHPGFDGGSRSSGRHSHGLYDTRTSSMGYSRDEISRGDTGRVYSDYGRDYMSRDYMPSGADGGSGSHSSLYSSRRLNDGYLSGRGSGSYY